VASEDRRGARSGAGFVVCFDPVDGASELDVNGIMSTIFSVPQHQRRQLRPLAA
jgi:fructose-1,6-bisphosphatase